MSNRRIAKQTGTSDKTVQSHRTELESTAEIPQLPRTTGADGRSRPARKLAAPCIKATTPTAKALIKAIEEGTVTTAPDGRIDFPKPVEEPEEPHEEVKRRIMAEEVDAVKRFVNAVDWLKQWSKTHDLFRESRSTLAKKAQELSEIIGNN